MKSFDFFLDSGAYTAFSKGVKINIRDYAEFIKQNKDVITVYANLDVIGDPEETWKNQMIMEEMGLSPLPVFHFKEPDIWLKKYLDHGCEYIAFGGLVTNERTVMHFWLDRMFRDFVCDSSGVPKIKVHGFGLTSFSLMTRYPWYSVDSTSWILTGRYGGVFVPKKQDNKYNYLLDPMKVMVSSRSSALDFEGKHFNTYTSMEQQVILEYFQEQGYVMGQSEIQQVEKGYKLGVGERWLGKEEADSQRNMYGDRSGYVAKGYTNELKIERIVEAGLSNDYRKRDELNIKYFIALEKALPSWPWPFKLKQTASLNFVV